MLCSGAERLASLYGVRPGKAAVVATTSDRGLENALALKRDGTLWPRRESPVPYAEQLRVDRTLP